MIRNQGTPREENVQPLVGVQGSVPVDAKCVFVAMPVADVEMDRDVKPERVTSIERRGSEDRQGNSSCLDSHDALGFCAGTVGCLVACAFCCLGCG
mmetsp:Transcript_9577/g.15682  ORF Transcript_9577/g.15682 Transcript_9577/m.15682 type:complete len:96 (-) Transcript_9577:510-797(-)